MTTLTAIAVTPIWDDINLQLISSGQVFTMTAGRILSLVKIGSAYLDEEDPPSQIGSPEQIFRVGSVSAASNAILRLQKLSGNIDLIANPTGERAINLPDESGTIALLSDIGSGQSAPKPTTFINYASNISIPILPEDRNFAIILTGNCTLNMADGAFDGQAIRVSLIQDATGGRLVTLSNKFRFSDSAPSSAFILSSAANKKDVFVCTWDDAANKWDMTFFMAGF